MADNDSRAPTVLNIATYFQSATQRVAGAAGFPNANWNDGMNKGGSTVIGIGASTGVINPAGWTEDDNRRYDPLDGSAKHTGDNMKFRQPLSGQHIGTVGGDGSENNYNQGGVATFNGDMNSGNFNEDLGLVTATADTLWGQVVGATAWKNYATEEGNANDKLVSGDRVWGIRN